MATVQDFYDQVWKSEQQRQEDTLLLLIRDSAIRYSYTLLGNLQHKKLLEIGCGAGLQTKYFLEQGAAVTAIDVSKESIRLVQESLGTAALTAIEMDAEHLDFPQKMFDVVYINSVLMHVNQQKVLQEVLRVLKVGGKIIIVEPLKWSLFTLPFRLISPYRKSKPQYVHYDFPSLITFTDTAVHMPTVERKEFYFFFAGLVPLFYLTKRHSLVSSLLSPIEKADALLLRMLPFLRQISWMTVVGISKR